VFALRRAAWTNYILVDLLCPSRITHIWSFGFFLGIFFGLQIVTGLVLSLHYAIPGYDRVIYLSRELTLGEFFRFVHGNGVSLIFIGLFLHVFRGVGYNRFFLQPV